MCCYDDSSDRHLPFARMYLPGGSRCRSAQDAVREVGGLGVLLSHCNVDSSYPFLREWALLAVRNVCEGNEENQRSIEALKPQVRRKLGAAQTGWQGW